MMPTEEVIDTLTALHNVPDLLASTQSADRAALYQALGVCLFYRRSGPVEEVKALVSLGVDLKRVGGEIGPVPKRSAVFELAV